MYLEFTRNGLPRFRANPDVSPAPEEMPLPESPVYSYFNWLRWDAELAQQVADAWNAVVDRGGTELLQCYCPKCYAYPHSL